MEWVIYLAVILIAAGISYALAPKPPELRPPSKEDYKFPTIEIGRPHPILFGRKKMSGPNVSWWGKIHTRSIKK